MVVRSGEIEETEIMIALKTRISAFKVPKRVIFLEQLPRNTMSKVQKNLLREQFADLLKLK